MNTYRYVVESLDGDYAHLKRTGEETDHTVLVARALLPAEITEGTKLLYENLEYTVLEE